MRTVWEVSGWIRKGIEGVRMDEKAYGKCQVI